MAARQAGVTSVRRWKLILYQSHLQVKQGTPPPPPPPGIYPSIDPSPYTWRLSTKAITMKKS